MITEDVMVEAYKAALQEATLQEVYACLRRLSPSGVAPGRVRFDRLRDPGLPSSTTLRRHGLSWAEVVTGAGLALGERALGRMGRPTLGVRGEPRVPADVEVYVQRARGMALHAEDYRHVEDGLQVVPGSRRVEVREFEYGGQMVRIEREILMLR